MTADAHSDIPILLLAAGQSRRMRGRDKLLETIDGQAMLRRQAKRARAATTGPVIVALPPPPHPRYDALGGLNVTCVAVPDASNGLSASLKRALAALPDTVDAAMILLVDLPDVTTADLREVLAQVNHSGSTLIWRGATEDGAPGHPIVFASSLFPALQGVQGDTGGAEVVAQHKNRTQIVRLPGSHALRDLDTPEDWARWRADQSGSE